MDEPAREGGGRNRGGDGWRLHWVTTTKNHFIHTYTFYAFAQYEKQRHGIMKRVLYSLTVDKDTVSALVFILFCRSCSHTRNKNGEIVFCFLIFCFVVTLFTFFFPLCFAVILCHCALQLERLAQDSQVMNIDRWRKPLHNLVWSVVVQDECLWSYCHRVRYYKALVSLARSLTGPWIRPNRIHQTVCVCVCTQFSMIVLFSFAWLKLI